MLVYDLNLRGVEELYEPGGKTPDYGCLMLPLIDGRNMEARGTFVNITKRGTSRKRPEYRPEQNVWQAAGYLQERSGERAAYTWHAIGGPEAVYARDGHRYIYIRSSRSDCENPKALKGMSGSGVWEIPISSRPPDETIQIGTPLLRGVTFWQEDAGEGQVAFYAHELESIADDIVSKLEAGQSGPRRAL